jgi:hypothetical protein
MFAEKSPVDFPQALVYQKQLELLYARRSAIDSLIRSLVDYDRLRLRRLEITLKEKTA